MTRVLLGVSGLGLALAACSFPAPDLIDAPPADAPVDAPDAPTDAPYACTPDAIVCDDAQGIYIDCSPEGTVEFQITCPLGCATDMEKCLDIDPSNGLAMYLDMAATAPDLVLQGNSSIDTRNGIILVAGEGVTIPTAVANGIRVFAVRSLTIDGVAQVQRDYGNWPLAFVSHGNVLIRGTLDVSAQGFEGGAGAYWGGDQSESGPCAGLWTSGQGASGAGGGEPGGGGGQITGLPRTTGGPAGAAIEPLRGGCEGGTNLALGTSSGGGGGGGLQITSRTRIDLVDSGVIDASGGGATHENSTPEFSGGGGGAGGNVLLEAPQVVLNGTNVVISTKGGGGAGAGTTTAANGADGGIGPGRAPGGPSTQQAPGGPGGDGTLAPGAGSDFMCSPCKAGGGGGASGMIVFRTMAGSIAPQNGAAVRSKTMVTAIRTRYLP